MKVEGLNLRGKVFNFTTPAVTDIGGASLCIRLEALGGADGCPETWFKDSSDFGEEYGIYFFQLDLKMTNPWTKGTFFVSN